MSIHGSRRPGSLVGWPSVFRRPVQRHRLRVEVGPPDIATVLANSADDDAVVVDRDGVLANVDDRERRVPLSERVAAQHVRADQIVQRKIVWQATPVAVLRRLSSLRSRRVERAASTIAPVFLDLPSKQNCWKLRSRSELRFCLFGA